jgi:ATP-binding cassette, subfamily C, bacterial
MRDGGPSFALFAEPASGLSIGLADGSRAVSWHRAIFSSSENRADSVRSARTQCIGVSRTTPTLFAHVRLYRGYWACFRQYAGKRLWLAVGLLIVISFVEGSSLLMLVPLLHTLGFGGSGGFRGFAAIATILQGKSPRAALPLVLAIFIVLKIVQALLRAFSNTLNLRIQTDFICFLRERFYRAMMQANWLFLTRQRSSDLSQTLLTELSIVGGGTRHALALLSILLLAFVQVGIAMMLSPAMTFLALVAGVVVGFGLRQLRRHSHTIGEHGYGKRAEMAAAVSEHLAGMKIAKGYGRETQHFAHFRRAMNEIAAHVMRLQYVSAVIGVWLEVGAVLALSLFVYFAVDRVGSAELLVLVFVFTRLLAQTTTIQNVWHEIGITLPSFINSERLREQLITAAEPPTPRVVERVVLNDTIRLENVSFCYGPAQPTEALHAVNLSLPARQAIALCGPSGAGKSTMADLLLGLLSPTTGRVLIDDAELASETVHRWRQSVGYVPQETFLFHETVRANLLWAQPDATERDLRAALRAAAAEEFVDRLPSGLDTIVGDRGVRLSGGERQRVALARALLRRPTLLLLDEATSALDPHNERLVRDAIERLHGELTIVLIAHRLSTVRMADRIVVLESGQVVETGTWGELSNRKGGAFHRLIAADAGA